MSFDDFKLILDKIPPKSTMSFAGFSEPTINPWLGDMLNEAYKRGFEIMLLTTLFGMTIEKYNDIKDLQYAHFSIHLPDSNNKSDIEVTSDYLEVLEYVINSPPKGNFLFCHHSGDVHPKIKHLINHSYLLEIHDRSGNLDADDVEVRHCYKSGNIACGHRFLNGNSGLILPNGDVQVCCSDFGLENTLGNIFTDSWDDLFQSDKYKEIVYNNSNGLDSICRKCELAYTK